jgi:hypothetical protein
MSNAFTADRERTVYMGDATHRESTATKQGDTKMYMNMEELRAKIHDVFDEISHTLIEDYPTGKAHTTTGEKMCWMDGFIEALEWVLSEVGE